MVEKANLCLGDTKAKRERNDWFDDDCEKALAVRYRAKLEEDRYKTEKSTRIYEEKRKRVKRTKATLLLGDTTDNLERWAQYFEELLNEGEEQEQQTTRAKRPDLTENREQEDIEKPTE